MNAMSLPQINMVRAIAAIGARVVPALRRQHVDRPRQAPQNSPQQLVGCASATDEKHSSCSIRAIRYARRESGRTSKQQVVVELLHHLPLVANRVQLLQQQRAQQLRGWDRRPTELEMQRPRNVPELGRRVLAYRDIICAS
jgi:hypothetical protein